jgi:uncharacterized membrane protein YbhN (UPF0104 family)
MQEVQVQLLCAMLFAADLAARSVRLRALAAGAGGRLSSIDALRINLLADAGAAITPMRFGGEPARVAGLASAGVRMPAIAATIGWELVTAWPTLFVMGVALMIVAAPDWLATTWPTIAARANGAWPILVAALALAGAALIAAQLLRKRVSGAFATHLDSYTTPWRSMPRRALLVSVACSVVNVATRTALLPVLALSLPTPPEPATVWLGSFMLTYGQLVLPTPAGVGLVELGFLGGAAGEFGGEIGLLLAWRWWANLLPAILGLAVAWQLRRRLFRLVRP